MVRLPAVSMCRVPAMASIDPLILTPTPASVPIKEMVFPYMPPRAPTSKATPVGVLSPDFIAVTVPSA